MSEVIKVEYKLTIEMDKETFDDIDIPHYSGPYHDWFRTQIVLSLGKCRGAPQRINIEPLSPIELVAIQFANAMKNL